METTVSLQEPFSYGIWPFVVVGILMGLYGVYCLAVVLLNKKTKAKPIQMQPLRRINPQQIKQHYLMRLEHIQQQVAGGNITMREAYQEMSLCIREFVSQVTGIPVHNYTLEDIRKMHMPELEALLTEYYVPEFAWKTVSDTYASLEKTKRAIQLWN